MNYKLTLFLVFMLSITAARAQTSGNSKKDSIKPVQISGIIVTNDSIPQFVPYAHVVVKRKNRGTISNAQGFFSMAALPGDSLRISTIGFRTEFLVIPDTLSQKEYLARVRLLRDTSLLEEVTLYPWPTPDQFKNSFLATRVPTTEEDIAMRNLAVQELKARAAEMGWVDPPTQDLVEELVELLPSLRLPTGHIVASELRSALQERGHVDPDRTIAEAEDQGDLLIYAEDYGQSRHGRGLYGDPRKQLVKLRIVGRGIAS